MSNQVNYQPGWIGLVAISGEVGAAIRFLQWLNSHPVDRWLDQEGNPNFEHAFVYLGNDMLIEAEPGGARIVNISEYENVDVYWCENIAATVPAGTLPKVATAAATFEGVPYSFLDYLELTGARLHLPVGLLRDDIAHMNHVICSQLAALSYREAGHDLFPGKWRDLVAPYDIWALDQQLSSIG